MAEASIARVVVNLSLDREFDYRIPAELRGLVQVGSKVRVPFGKNRQCRAGYVVGLRTASAFPDLKDIAGVEGKKGQIPEDLVRLARWMADYYCCAHEQAVRATLPAVVRGGRVKHKRQLVAELVDGADLTERLPALEKKARKQAAVLRALVRLGPSSLVQLQRAAGPVSASVIKRLEADGLIRIEERVVERDPFANDVILPSEHLRMNPEQTAALKLVVDSIKAPAPAVILLHGVTGSGKTEVYLQAIAECLRQGREAIVLVPEISLTPQTTERFRSRFGDRVSVLHSRLSDGERYDEWTKISEGRAPIVVGARSALFAPFRNLGLIVVDEEHETTYKQEEAPRYHARDVAVVRGRFERATVVLGSATPELESFHNCQIGKYTLARLSKRVDDRRMPVMEVVDMRAEAALRGRPQVFSRRLEDLINERLNRGEQTIVFLNRRGYATQMLCTKCGHVATCDDCSITYTYHRHDERLCCHLCGRVLAAPKVCPICQDPGIRYSGLGTEKVEAIARGLFPKATIGRMDSDSMTGKHAHRTMLDAFRAGRVHILIGTQMIAKGLDFPNVTLVGIVFADLSLHLPDFRAGERTFQLLTQVAGRAGRGDVPGCVVVQTYTPYHPALQCAVEHRFEDFFADEMADRRALGYPPVTHMAIIHLRGRDEMTTAAAARDFEAIVSAQAGAYAQVGSAAPAPITKVRNQFRYQIGIRTASIMKLTTLLRTLVLEGKKPKDVEIFVDIDPRSLL